MTREQLKTISALRVELATSGTRRVVGRLAWRERVCYFEYDPTFLPTKRELSPFKMRLAPGLIVGPENVFERLHGLFNDSLPDGWGRLLTDRKLSERGLLPGQLTPLDRLALVGSHGMGALTYHPEHAALSNDTGTDVDLDRLSEQAALVLKDKPQAALDALLKIGGSPQGARPKVLLGVSAGQGALIHGVDDLPDGYDHWIVKFRAAADPVDIGAIENAYADMARAAGVDMPPTALFPASKGPGYFGTSRFDRVANNRLHMHTVSGLLNLDHTLPSLGYDGLLKTARILTRRQTDVDQLFVRMVFNVSAHNRDDHTKNHSFLLGEDGAWVLSPAYDITFSAGPGGEHALSVQGEGKNPSLDHIRAVARNVGVGEKVATAAVEQVSAAVGRWPAFAKINGVSRKSAIAIDQRLKDVWRSLRP
jgi:serine/threonine-protein kinase HipA